MDWVEGLLMADIEVVEVVGSQRLTALDFLKARRKERVALLYWNSLHPDQALEPGRHTP